MKKDYFDGNEWTTVSDEWLEGIKNPKLIKEIYECANNKIKVVYAQGNELYYQNIHGSWGFPTKCR